MKNPGRFMALAAFAALQCILFPSGAAAWKVTSGTVTQGTFFQGSGVSFQAPPSYTLYDIFRADDADRVTLHSPKDNNQYSSTITVVLRREPFDLDQEGVDADQDSITADLEGTSAVCAADERLTVNGADAQRRIFFFYGMNARPQILIRYRINLSGIGVILDYQAHATSPFVFQYVAALPVLLESIRVE